jgi:hypothetical protein
MKEFRFNCPTCGQHILANAEWIGRRITCPSCDTRLTIRAPAQPPKKAPPMTLPPPATSSKLLGGALRVDVPAKRKPGNARSPALVKKLEQKARAAPEEVATAFHRELTEVRRRLDKLERRLGVKK